jgi:colicin import membrane protein
VKGEPKDMLKRSIVTSGALHLAVIVAATVAWPHRIALSDESSPVVPVEVVNIADVTDVAPTVQDVPKEQTPPEVPSPPSAPQPAAAAPPPPAAELAPDFDMTPKAKPKEPQKQADSAVPPPPKPATPRRKPQPDTAAQFDVDSVIALLDKRTPKAPVPTANAKPAEQTVTGIGAQDALTLDIKDALLSQMRECWNVPAGAPNPEQLIVQVRVFLAPDGNLLQPPQLEPATRAAVATNQYMRTAAEAASRAINICAPYKRLPPDKYDAWREIVMTFDPSKMIGR